MGAVKGNPVGKSIKKIRDDGFIRCAGCREYLPPSKYRAWSKEPPARCKKCHSEWHHEYRLKTVYGIDKAEYERMYALQDGKCAICRNTPRTRRLSVDHNHKTGQVRGLLCKRCNHDLLGAAYDSVEMLERAIVYLSEPPAVHGLSQRHIDMAFKKGLRGESRGE
jgi:hypothetical protein